MFRGEYARLYDKFHAGKDYQTEVRNLIPLLNLQEVDRAIGFDFGCGTGAHAHEFWKIGIQIDGFDSSSDMLKIAKTRNPSLNFSESLSDFGGLYDFTYSLFDVLSYQLTELDAMKLLDGLILRTKPGGVTLVDSWNSTGVLLDPPKLNERTVTSEAGIVIRRVRPNLTEAKSDIYELEAELILGVTGEIVLTETHAIRAWSPDQVIAMMREVGFREFSLFNPGEPHKLFQESDWRFGVRAKR